LSLEKRRVVGSNWGVVISGIFGGFEFPGTEKKVAENGFTGGEVAGIFPPSAILSAYPRGKF
jgi:hypothetical protein